ncbi:MAG TPA: hypothetical protein VF099_04270 [Ktedonobacterales bacterium]
MPGFYARSRRPNLKTAGGATRAKQDIKRGAGIPLAARPIHAPPHAKRRAKGHAGYYRGLMQMLRLLARLH